MPAFEMPRASLVKPGDELRVPCRVPERRLTGDPRKLRASMFSAPVVHKHSSWVTLGQGADVQL